MSTHHDLIFIGAGFAGIYAVHRFRDQMGLDVQGFDAASDVGGTWYWNRYPGARVDIESVHYSYSFSEELQQEWSWSEKFAAQPEILRYLNHVADRFDVRRSIRFDTRIVSVRWDDDRDLWEVTTESGEVHTARWFVSCAGTLSVPKAPEFPGVEDFEGQVLMTGRWTSDHDLSGKRVGIVGTGSSGIQAISEISKIASELTVFQRTPNYATPIGNHPTDPATEQADKRRYAEIREASRNHFLGVPYSDVQPSALAVSPQERRRVFEDRWERGGFRLFIDSFNDILFSQEANDTVTDFIREKIHERVEDPGVAELLCPKDYPYGTKRPPLETDYYEAYNRDGTRLVDVKANPIETVTAKGLRLADGTEYEFDVLVLATGFDASTGPLLAMNVSGRDGLALTDAWADGPQTYLGFTVSGFPNFYMVTGPQSPSVLYNMPLAIEDHIDLAADMIEHMRSHGHAVMDTTEQAQDQWVTETNAVAEMTLLPESQTSWYMGANIPGKPRRALVYLGGAPRYRAICDNVQQNGWRGYAFAADTAGLATAPSARALDPSVMFFVEALKQQEFPGFRAVGVEGAREVIEGFTEFQKPKQPVASVADHAYGPDPQQRLRIHRPDDDGSHPVLVMVHGGGFVAGGLDVADETARDLCNRTGAVVVTVTYRRAPEHRFPSAHDDVLAALEWVQGHIAEHGGDPDRIVLCGDSAGGQLALAAARSGRTPRLAGLLLVYPLVDPAAETESRREFAEGHVIELDDLAWFGEQYVSSPADLADPRLAQMGGTFDDLPPTLVLTAECDTLRDEGEALVDAMAAAGVDARAQRFGGLAHGVFWLSLAVPRCAEMREAAADFVTSCATREVAMAD